MNINEKTLISQHYENRPVIERVKPIKHNKFLKLLYQHRKKIILISFSILFLYIIMLIPIFYLYPQYNKPIKLNFKKEWFTEISSELKGDCFRRVQDFRRKCPFPTREIHLNSKHTLVEVKINRKWIAYDPSFDMFFNNLNVVQVSFDVNRGFYMDELQNYKYKDEFKKFYFYHNFYFILLKYTHPYYYKIERLFYGIKN